MSRQNHDNTCDGVLHAHVIYDKPAAGYRAQLRCACHAIKRTSKRLHTPHDDAEQEAKIWVATPPRVRPPRPSPAKVRTEEDRLCTTHGQINQGRRGPPLGYTFVPPTPVEVDAAWVGYWKTLCARAGHESRLSGSLYSAWRRS